MIALKNALIVDDEAHMRLYLKLMCTGKSGHEILLNGESKHGKKTL